MKGGHQKHSARKVGMGHQNGDFHEFGQNCLLCIISWAGERNPQPLATALHGQNPNEEVQMDCLYMGDAEKSDLK